MDCFWSNIIKRLSASLQDQITCSREHLSPKFDECTTLVEELDEDSKKKIPFEMMPKLFSKRSKCVKIVQARIIAEQCSKGMKKVTFGNISKMKRSGGKL